LHVLKSYSTNKLINEFPQKGWRLRSLNYLLKNCEKPAQQIDSWAVADLAHHVLLRTLMQSMIWCSVGRMHQERIKLPIIDQAVNPWRNRLNARVKAKHKHFEQFL